MKLQINKKIKTGLIALIIILTSISSFLLFREVRSPSYQEQNTPLYTYNNKGSVDYKVFLKPNNLYEEAFLDPEKLYITEYVDYIEASFNYEFNGERDADLKGTYEILVKVQGFTGEGEALKSIWEKDYEIIKEKQFDIKDTTKIIKEEIKLALEPYNNFATEIKETSKISSQTVLILVMNINLKGETDKGAIEETISPSLMIPLDTAMFEISGDTNIEKPGIIEETIQVQLPINSKQVLFYSMLIAMFLVALILLIFFVKASPNKDPHEKLLRRIFNKHGDRLVALNSELVMDGTKTSYVKSIDDLVRIADEIGKPILYKYSKNYREINMFYISDENRIYILDILPPNPFYKDHKFQL